LRSARSLARLIYIIRTRIQEWKHNNMLTRSTVKSWSAERQILAAALVSVFACAALTVYWWPLGTVVGVALVLAWIRPLAKRLQQAEQRLRAVTDHTAALVGYIDVDQRWTYNNATYEEWLNAERQAITGRKVSEVLGHAAYESLRPHIERALGGWRTSFETQLVAGGRVRAVQGTYVPDIDDKGQVHGVFELITDVTRMKDRERELARLAHYDPLTGAANPVAFNDHLCRALAHARRARTATAVMYLEIDRLQDLKAQLGPDARDELLREFAVRLKGSVRATDTVGRFGEDAFVVVLEGISGNDEVSDVARKVLRAVRTPIRSNDTFVLITAGIGIAVGAHDAAPDQLVQEAARRCRARMPLQSLGIAA
jgi:diguanylate cyclase (GGDEF)-like protein/PAS domain S-box-containing protein